MMSIAKTMIIVVAMMIMIMMLLTMMIMRKMMKTMNTAISINVPNMYTDRSCWGEPPPQNAAIITTIIITITIVNIIMITIIIIIATDKHFVTMGIRWKAITIIICVMVNMVD